jgi:cytochrome c oxidase assembly factor CtaG/polyferredoxin
VNSSGSAAFASWELGGRATVVLLLFALLYLRGWLRGRRLVRDARDNTRLAAFLGGLFATFLATESPLDAFDNLSLATHMVQHLLLMMIAPPLLLIGNPLVPLLRGLPKSWVKEGLAPFLRWQLLQKVFDGLTFPPVAWLLFALSTILWHVPAFYELALQSPNWHSAEHACFLWTGVLFWWNIILPGTARSVWPRWAMIPYLLLSDVLNTIISAVFIFSDKLLYPSYGVVHLGGLTPAMDQSLAGAIMWVPGSIIYLVPVVALTMGLFSRSPAMRPMTWTKRVVRPPVSGLVQIGMPPSAAKRWKYPQLRRVAQAGMLVLAIAVVIDGFWGPQIAPVNLAGVLPWIHWRALTVAALLLIGNLFCMSCPFMLVRDMGRKVFPGKWRWPRMLRNKWLPFALLAIYLWTYEAFSLWNNPWLTAAVIVGYFLTALIVDSVFRGASFCKYVCPIGQFHFVTSFVSPREVGIRKASVCDRCKTHDCIRGNAEARGCELYLFQPKKVGNMDCTFCMDCVKACPHDNVTLMPTAPADTLTVDPYRSSLGRLSKRTDIVALALLIVFGAFINAAQMVSPVMMWEHGWHARLGMGMMPAVVGVVTLLAVVIMPVIAVLLCGALNRLVDRSTASVAMIRRFALTLVPIGVAMWAAHLLFHFATGWALAGPAFERAVTGTITPTAALAIVPDWLTPVQILLLDGGLLLTLYVGWKIALQYAEHGRRAFSFAAPWGALACGLYAAGIWILFQPMQMRGMVM